MASATGPGTVAAEPRAARVHQTAHDNRASVPRALRTATFDQAAQLGEIRAQWDALAVGSSNPYCSPAWMLSWWKHVAPSGALLRVHAVFEGAELVGLAPFFVDREIGGVVRYRLLSAGTSAPLDILARPGMEETVAAETARWLAAAAPRPDVIMFEGLRGGSLWPALLQARWPRAKQPRISRQYSQFAPFIEIAGQTHRQWLAQRSSKFRRKLRHEREAFEELGGMVRRSQNNEELTADLDEFVRLHHRRWRARGGSGVLDAPVERMLRDAGPELVEQGRLRLWSMHLDGRVISSQLLVAAGGETAYWLGGFDDEETRVRRPGLATVFYALEHAFDAGDGRFDLGPGAQAYKHELTQSEHALDWVVLVPRGWRAPLAGLQMAKPRMRQALARGLPPAVKQLVRRALALKARLSGS